MTPLLLGMVLLAVAVVGGYVTWGGLPWTMGPANPGSTALTLAAKVDAIVDMLRGRVED